MKRYLPHLSAILILIAIIVGGFGHVANAGSCLPIPGQWNTNDCVIDLFGSAIDILLGAASWILALSGYVLNFSMKLTLNIKTFVDNTGAIYLVWKSIRDISGMFIIFTLIFAAIKMILAPIGVPGPSVGKLITTVVTAGILINFSFFIAGLGIDISNVISAQLYKVIAPESNISGDMKVNPSSLRAGLDGGISDIFMSSLKIQKLYESGLAADPGRQDQNPAETTIRVIWSGIIGIVIMITSALSFFLAALAFIVRFVILIFLLGFSPIWLAAYAIPDLKKYADMWTNTYKSQLIFMPVYLLLLYFGLSVLTSADLFWAGSFDGAGWQEKLLVFGINAAFVIIMLNAPLLAALSIGAMMPKWANNVGAGAIWKSVGGWAGGIAGRGTMRVTGASKVDGYLANTKVGNTQWMRDLRSVTTGPITKAKFGSSRSIEDVDKLGKDVQSKAKEIQRVKDIKALIANGSATRDEYANVFKSVKPADRVELIGKDNLKNPSVWKNLGKAELDAIEKSDKFSPDDISSIKNARNAALTSAVADGRKDDTSHVLKNTNTEDLAEIISSNTAMLANPNFIGELTSENLTKLKGGLTEPQQHEIAKTILTWRSGPSDPAHPAEGWMKREAKKWVTSDVTAHGKTYAPEA
ncbi:MAG: hypothetical protein RLY66_65 [Candidatus Parcubacteria bacterium]|jgi:hypothetical protein